VPNTINLISESSFDPFIHGPAKTFSPADLWSVEMKTLGKAFEPEIAEGHNVVVFVRSGVVRVGAEGLVSSPF